VTTAYDDTCPSYLTTQFGEEMLIYVAESGAPVQYDVVVACATDVAPVPVQVATITSARPVALTEDAAGRLTAHWVDDTGFVEVRYVSDDRGATWTAA
jgi:hypothetical protein